MIEVQIPVQCGCGCKVTTTLLVNLWTGENRILKAKGPTGYAEKMAIIDHYKKLRGYDKLPSWDRAHKPRAMKRAGELLAFFSMLEDPVGVAKECLTSIFNECQQKGWAFFFEKVNERAPDWLIQKQKGEKR
jgi:hypothetical protein